MNKKIIYLILVFLVLFGGYFFFKSDSKEISSNELDAYFIEQMIPHHRDAIAMAELAKQKAEHDEIKDLADDIIEAQTDEIEQMTDWYEDWFDKSPIGSGSTTHATHGSTTMGSMADMAALQNAKPFDREFINQMIIHHEGALTMAQMLRAGTARDEMKKLADDIIKAQSGEIAQMKTWWASWYR